MQGPDTESSLQSVHSEAVVCGRSLIEADVDVETLEMK